MSSVRCSTCRCTRTRACSWKSRRCLGDGQSSRRRRGARCRRAGLRRAHEAAHDLAVHLVGEPLLQPRARQQRHGVVARVDARRLDARRLEADVARAESRNSCSSSAPATQPVHIAMLAFTGSGSPSRTITSLTAKRPPGRSTRNASASTRRLSPERLITQFEMITSTVFDGSGIASMCPLRNSTFVGARLRLVLQRERQHLVGHVEPIRLAGRTDAPGREQHVDPAAGAQVEHDLALAQIGERGRVAAAERREQRLGGDPRRLSCLVQVGGDRVPRFARRAAASARAIRWSAAARGRRRSFEHALRGGAVARLHRGADLLQRGHDVLTEQEILIGWIRRRLRQRQQDPVRSTGSVPFFGVMPTVRSCTSASASGTIV